MRSSSSGVTSDARNRVPTNGESNIFKKMQRLNTFREEASFFKNVALTIGGSTILSDAAAAGAAAAAAGAAAGAAADVCADRAAEQLKV